MVHLFAPVFIVATLFAWPQDGGADWKTGSRLNKALEKTVLLSWTDAPLRDSLERFSAQQGIAIALDRRVDPGQIVQKDFGHHSVEETIYLIADEVDAGVCRLGDVFYIGPREEVANLILKRAAILDSLDFLSEESRELLADKQPMKWSRLARPDDLLKELVDDSKATLQRQPLPHDLWPAADFPAATLIDRITILTFGFEIQTNIESDGNGNMSINLVSFESTNSASYKFGQTLPQDTADEVKREFKECELDNQPDGLTVTGSPLEIYEIGRLLAQAQARDHDPNGAEVVVTLHTTAQIGSILNKVAQNLNVELSYDPELISELKERVTVSVDKASYETLLKKTLQSTDLEFEITDDQLIIRNKE